MTSSTFVAGLLLTAVIDAQVPLQQSRHELIAALQSGDLPTKANAASAIADRRELHKDPVVKAAVLTELREAVKMMKLRRETQAPIGSAGGFEYADVYLGLIRATRQFPGEDVMLALIPTIGSSASAREHVASFGEVAIDPLITACNAPSGTEDPASERLGLLDTLSQVALGHRLSSAATARLRSLAVDAMNAKQPPEIGGGMLLGAALRDPALVTAIRELRASGFSGVNPTRSPNYLERMAKKALERAGIK